MCLSVCVCVSKNQKNQRGSKKTVWLSVEHGDLKIKIILDSRKIPNSGIPNSGIRSTIRTDEPTRVYDSYCTKIRTGLTIQNNNYSYDVSLGRIRTPGIRNNNYSYGRV